MCFRGCVIHSNLCSEVRPPVCSCWSTHLHFSAPFLTHFLRDQASRSASTWEIGLVGIKSRFSLVFDGLEPEGFHSWGWVCCSYSLAVLGQHTWYLMEVTLVCVENGWSREKTPMAGSPAEPVTVSSLLSLAWHYTHIHISTKAATTWP